MYQDVALTVLSLQVPLETDVPAQTLVMRRVALFARHPSDDDA